MRRAALGAVAILRAHPRLAGITIASALATAARHEPVEVTEARQAEAVEFTVRRYEQALLDAGHEHRLVQAVLPLAARPTRADATLAALTGLVGDPAFGSLAEAMQRVRRIVPAGTAAGYDTALFAEPAETALGDAVAKARAELGGAPDDLAEFASVAAALVVPVNEFFEAVLVMAEDPAVRANRLGLLAAVRDLAAGVVGWEALG
jgi:glycyl-tRNA synthetase